MPPGLSYELAQKACRKGNVELVTSAVPGEKFSEGEREAGLCGFQTIDGPMEMLKVLTFS